MTKEKKKDIILWIVTLTIATITYPWVEPYIGPYIYGALDAIASLFQ
ncbi:MAG: hypothetical protein Q4A55_07425 [Aerococcus sp.]|nr:hypothetical protein [Aerococcus sp.]